MNNYKFSVFFLIAGLFGSYARASQVEAEAKVLSLRQLAANRVARIILSKKENIFLALSKNYNSIPPELKALIISSYGKSISAQELLHHALPCVLRSSKMLERAQQNVLRAKQTVLSLQTQLVSEYAKTNNPLLKERIEANNAQAEQLNPLLDYIDSLLKVPHDLDVENAAQRTIDLLLAHDFFEDLAIQQPLTKVCLAERYLSGRMQEKNAELAKMKFAIFKNALITLLPENEWNAAIKQLLTIDELTAAQLLLLCTSTRGFSQRGIIELYLWACLFEKPGFAQLLEFISNSAENQYMQNWMAKVKKLYGIASVTLSDEDEYYESIRATINLDDLREMCRGNYAPILARCTNLPELENVRVFLPMPDDESDDIWYDLCDFACEMGYTSCVDELLARGFHIRDDYTREFALFYGRKTLVGKVWQNSEQYIFNMFGFSAIFRRISATGGRRTADALKTFINQATEFSLENRTRVFAEMFACSALWENKKMFEYLKLAWGKKTNAPKNEAMGLALSLLFYLSEGESDKKCSVATIKLLLESGAPLRLDQPDRLLPQSPLLNSYFDELTGRVLYDAVNLFPNLEIIRYLIEQGAKDEVFELNGERICAYDIAKEKHLQEEITQLLKSVRSENLDHKRAKNV